MSRLSREKKKSKKKERFSYLMRLPPFYFVLSKFFIKRKEEREKMKGERKKDENRSDWSQDFLRLLFFIKVRYIPQGFLFSFFLWSEKNLFLPSWYNVVCAHSHQYSRSIYNYPSISILLKDKGKESFARPSSIVVPLYPDNCFIPFDFQFSLRT